MFEGYQPTANLHVFSRDCPEVDRMRLFRDWLRHSREDAALDVYTKRRLAGRDWHSVQNYADAKQDVIDQIMARARDWAGLAAS